MSKIQLPDFKLGKELTEEQKAYFDKHGVIVFKDFLSRDTVNLYLQEIQQVEKKLLTEQIDKINGVPLKFGRDENDKTIIQRFCFTTKFSDPLHLLLQDPRLAALTEFLAPYDGRIGEYEKDGLVVNNYIRTPQSTFSQMGWHTDSPRDLFMGQKIMPMLNVGIHLDDCPFENGGLRVIPGTHKQNMLKLLFGKKYFIDNDPDPKEIGFDITAGTLSVHDGRLWHRVQQSPNYGKASQRRVMYVPIVTGKYKPKSETSKTPFYHRFSRKVHKWESNSPTK